MKIIPPKCDHRSLTWVHIVATTFWISPLESLFRFPNLWVQLPIWCLHLLVPEIPQILNMVKTKLLINPVIITHTINSSSQLELPSLQLLRPNTLGLSLVSLFHFSLSKIENLVAPFRTCIQTSTSSTKPQLWPINSQLDYVSSLYRDLPHSSHSHSLFSTLHTVRDSFWRPW